ncbi:MAG: hypothetical protein C4288_15185 [Leptolyngbya sp. ERB_1_1]
MRFSFGALPIRLSCELQQTGLRILHKYKTLICLVAAITDSHTRSDLHLYQWWEKQKANVLIYLWSSPLTFERSIR